MTIALEQFPSSCVDLVKLVSRTGEEVCIADGGQALARLVPPPALAPAALFGKLAQQTCVRGDIVSAVPERWEADV